ncbi:hypothetical protein IQR32_12810 [Acinetobacter albensis]|uniref:hypothetical protein n=1 Tax=Acinetobacter albensis TaxID=1673609 RepID=UPI00187FFF4E|nr:hypothetical protein [Acinetobacter albensis]MBE9402186.1 hypothetical protein [Acinetobacter albensis]
MHLSPIKTVLSLAILVTLLAGCATSTLIQKDNRSHTRDVKTSLVDDQVVAFGKLAQVQNHLPADSLVIAGYKNSYVLTQGGAQFVRLINKLDAKNIQMTKELTFYSEKNDGHFSGTLPLSYVKLQEDINKKDLEFYIENGAEECSTSSDKRMNAQRFCFNLKLSGVVYPVAGNIASLKALSKPYQVNIYTMQKESYQSHSGLNPLQKLVLFPFAVAIDVISLPFQAAEKIFD